ncbi:MAG: hypothetical protein IKI76_04120 [Selenomonadaceae bacterium]|nr:hypothetical protein [Selenomonadaceae bacterium]MBR0102022.1 hypothetical protein [Selenomonadaceae bacterium]MBR6712163.1 hypothetical protein [Selenomonadaceae bacterium]
MQKGIATLEVILAALIIALLMKIAVPNAARLIDRAALDYETKRLYSELRFLQAMNRSAKFNTTGTGLSDVSGEYVSIKFTTEPPSYQVVRGLDLNVTGKPVRETHYLSYGVKFSSPSSSINFDSQGKASITSNHITLTSRLGNTKKISFDSVGRMQGADQ